MCGFAGIMDRSGTGTDGKILKKMGEVIHYRGPDDEGYYADSHLGFAFRRLSIIDLESGHQPIEIQNHVIVYNGELYNYRIIREELIRLGHIFFTQSDTEVVLRAYLEWKEEALTKFNGMWAFAIWNKENKQLFLSRDRLGIKPLYVADIKDKVFFASEIKSILQAGFTAQINQDDLAEYFHFGFIAGEKTMFKNIYALNPGTWIKFSLKDKKEGKYWEIDDAFTETGWTKEEAERQVLSLIDDSVSFRLISDVPLGSLLSGGVDSSILSAHASKNTSEGHFHTYSVKIDQADYDESGYAELAAKICQSVHKNTSISKEDYLANLPHIAWLHDEPINFDNALYMFSVCSLAKNDDMKVLLSGEGADELFGGYIRYTKTLDRLRSNQSQFNKDDLIVLGSAVYGFEKVKRLIGQTDWQNSWRQEKHNKFKHLPPEDLLMRLDQNTRLVSLLYRQDRMSMGAGIETRVPFLDYRLVELANKIPASLKLTDKESKVILKNVALNLGFAKEAIFRPKLGFPTSVGQWIRAKQFTPFLNFVASGDSSASEYYDVDFAKELVEENHEGKANHGTILWSLASFELWTRIFIDQSLNETNFCKEKWVCSSVG